MRPLPRRWLLYLLARTQPWQDRVRAEITAAGNTDDGTAPHIDRPSCTRMVLKEAKLSGHRLRREDHHDLPDLCHSSV